MAIPYNAPPYLEMKKVLLVANTDWYLYNFRLSFAQYLQGKGLSIGLVSPPGKYAQELASAGFHWIPWTVDRRSIAVWAEFFAWLKLVAIYRREKPDLVHHFTVKPVLYGSIATSLLHVPGTINSITGLGYLFLQNSKTARFLRMMTKMAYRRIFSRQGLAVIFENESDRSFFLNEALVSAEKSFLIQGVGVDTDYFLPTPEPDGQPVVVLPARLLWDKGVGVLVEAARLIRQRCDARIALVGEPDPGNPVSIDPEIIQRWVQEGSVEWWGWKSDMRQVYQDSTIVTLPSMGEGLPTALIEACASGRPIVTTDVPGCRDVVIDGVNGILVRPNDPQALAQGIITLLETPDLRTKMGKMGREIALKRFGNATIFEQNWQVYAKHLKLQ